jgi:type II secretory pathway pseudopilin PulG
MYLEGQGAPHRDAANDGYAMAALLVTMGVMAVLMSAALPVWRHQAQREKEAELIFRGEQYARAIGLYQRKMGPGNYPPSVDILVSQRFLRKKYKDPMVEDGEFQMIPFGGQQQPGIGGAPGGIGPGRQGGPGSVGMPGGLGAQPPQRGGFGTTPGSGITAAGTGAIMGVVSKSKQASIRIYKGASYYNQWQFIGLIPQQQPGGGVNQPGGRGGPGRGGPGRGGTPGSGPIGGPGRGRGDGRGTGPGGPGRGFGEPGRGFPIGRGGRGF